MASGDERGCIVGPILLIVGGIVIEAANHADPQYWQSGLAKIWIGIGVVIIVAGLYSLFDGMRGL
ncbi:MAG TPA: hypothetical protein VN937_12755 [Blastocatellia bacterium]|nr:hypothetical protein [Blastocatellia bacterium]